jgi:hypothetical protein
MLANAIGGTGAIKAAVVGVGTLPNNERPTPVNGVSLQPINDMKATIEAIAGALAAVNLADRPTMAKGLMAARTMSKTAVAKHPQSLVSVDEGLQSAVATVQKPIQVFNQAEFNTAYNLNERRDRGQGVRRADGCCRADGALGRELRHRPRRVQQGLAWRLERQQRPQPDDPLHRAALGTFLTRMVANA